MPPPGDVSLPEDPQAFPITRGILEELARVAGDAKFELGLIALARGLLT